MQERLAALAAEATQVANANPLDSHRPKWQVVSAEWRATTAGLPVDAIDPGVYARYTAAVARWQERDQAAREASREASARAAADNLARLQDLANRAAALVAAAALTAG